LKSLKRFSGLGSLIVVPATGCGQIFEDTYTPYRLYLVNFSHAQYTVTIQQELIMAEMPMFSRNRLSSNVNSEESVE
jgi:hypothetical protein